MNQVLINLSHLVLNAVIFLYSEYIFLLSQALPQPAFYTRRNKGEVSVQDGNIVGS